MAETAVTLHGRERVIGPAELTALRGIGAVAGLYLFPVDPFRAALARAIQAAITSGRTMARSRAALGDELRKLAAAVEHDRRKARRRARRTGERFRVEVTRGRRVYVFTAPRR